MIRRGSATASRAAFIAISVSMTAMVACGSSSDDSFGDDGGLGGTEGSAGVSPIGGSGTGASAGTVGTGGAQGGGASGASGSGGHASGGAPNDGGTNGTLAGSKPNIVVIMVDDLDAASLDQLLAQDLMPNLKSRIIDAGLTFDEAFVTNSLCCPSRATFLSGQYSHNHGVLSNAGGYEAFLLHDQSTVAVRLHDAGYRTAHIGKYLNGYSDASYHAPGWDEWQTTLDGSTYNLYEYQLIISTDGSPTTSISPGTYQTDELAERAASFIQRSTAQPFFTVIMPLAPHVEVLPGQSFDNFREMYKLRIRPAPRHAGTLRAPNGSGGYLDDQPRGPEFDLTGRNLPSFNEADVSDKPSWLKDGPNGTEGPWPLLDAEFLSDLMTLHLDRLESMLAVDDLIGTIFAELDARGIAQETLVVFTSDNGFFMGEHRLNNKMFPYEEGLRVPLYVKPPGAVMPRAEERMVLNNDLAPTLCAYAGNLDGWNVDGRSLIPLIEQQAVPAWRKRFLVEHWFLRVNSNGLLQYNDLPDYAAVRTGQSHATYPNQIYVEYTKSASPPVYDRTGTVFETEHYDLNTDLSEVGSVHANASYDAARATLASELGELVTCSGDACRAAEDE